MPRTSRRTFLKQSAGATAALVGLSASTDLAGHVRAEADAANVVPWYRRTLR
jgi:hypothetical protein